MLSGRPFSPVEVRETLPQQFPLPGSPHQTCVSWLGVQSCILGAETNTRRGLWPPHLCTGETWWVNVTSPPTMDLQYHNLRLHLEQIKILNAWHISVYGLRLNMLQAARLQVLAYKSFVICIELRHWKKHKYRYCYYWCCFEESEFGGGRIRGIKIAFRLCFVELKCNNDTLTDWGHVYKLI